jgi:hypothetical protein
MFLVVLGFAFFVVDVQFPALWLKIASGVILGAGALLATAADFAEGMAAEDEYLTQDSWFSSAG